MDEVKISDSVVRVKLHWAHAFVHSIDKFFNISVGPAKRLQSSSEEIPHSKRKLSPSNCYQSRNLHNKDCVKESWAELSFYAEWDQAK